MSNITKSIIHEKVLDDRGRCITPSELRWIRNKLIDPYDTRWLILCLNVITGLRVGKSCVLTTKDFVTSNGVLWLKTWQNKPKVNKKNEQIRIVSKPKHVPLPSWFASWIMKYIKYKLHMSNFTQESEQCYRLFPNAYPQLIQNMFYKLRKKYAKEAPWLNDVYKIIEHYDPITKQLIKTEKLYRISSHAGRAFYTTAAYEIVGKDIRKTMYLSGHEREKDAVKYTKVSDINIAKLQIKDQIMEPLMQDNGLPILKGQKKLLDF